MDLGIKIPAPLIAGMKRARIIRIKTPVILNFKEIIKPLRFICKINIAT